MTPDDIGTALQLMALACLIGLAVGIGVELGNLAARGVLTWLERRRR